MTCRTTVMMDEDPTPKMAWLGLVHGNGESWRGQAHSTRSAAFSEMEKANDELGLCAELHEPFPDDHPW